MRQGTMQLAHEKKPVSLGLLFKGIVGCSIAALAIVGALGINSELTQAAVASMGAIVGLLLALGSRRFSRRR